MQMIFCPNCQRERGFKRALGLGTLFLVLISAGAWLLLVPVYPARCIVCGLRRGSAITSNLKANPGALGRFIAIFSCLFIALVLVVAVLVNLH